MTKFLTLGAIALAVALGLGWTLTSNRAPAALDLAAYAEDGVDEVDISGVTDMVLGEVNAPVEVIEYLSFTCPHCAQFHQTVFKELKENYIDTGKIRFVSREVYLDRFGLWAGMIARCPQDTKRYFGLSGLILEKQRDWIGDGNPEEIIANLRKLGKTAGLTDAALDQCLNDGDNAKALVKVFQNNMEIHPIEGTPAVFVDGTLVDRASYEAISAAIEAKLSVE